MDLCGILGPLALKGLLKLLDNVSESFRCRALSHGSKVLSHKAEFLSSAAMSSLPPSRLLMSIDLPMPGLPTTATRTSPGYSIRSFSARRSSRP
ncbi:hypothetical protein K402DRAFT_191339 [Aulographum hederae CBS 113979]|uniref:Uncharacterized protein n=1 Tax=Aulographum hederae CBS 113979 TaxID=1176131 RepID=A0A6G1GNY0_9PEZI|nr:hypothetical protein K402DRAFT_191339 [Aulographum hederae CBS 113979]